MITYNFEWIKEPLERIDDMIILQSFHAIKLLSKDYGFEYNHIEFDSKMKKFNINTSLTEQQLKIIEEIFADNDIHLRFTSK